MAGFGTRVLLAGLASLAAGPAGAAGGGRWAAEVHLGGAWNLPVRLAIRQDGHQDIRLRSRWRTRATDLPLYYVARVVRRGEHHGWSLSLTHHKLHLANPPVQVQSFAVSHGYNLLTLDRLLERGPRRYGFGAGVVIAHPENEVRGRRLEERGGVFGSGYHLTGPVVSALAAWLPARRRGFYPAVEARVSAAHARVPVAGGRATVPNVALHLTLGVGWQGTR